MQRFQVIHPDNDGMNQEGLPSSSPAEDLGKSPVMQLASANKRDSGYGTDFNSPASQASGTSAPQAFVYGSFSEEMETMTYSEHNEDVFIASGEGDMADEDNGDDTDKEVEGLLCDSVEVNHTVSQPIDIQRPQAPIPTPEERENDIRGADNDVEFMIGDDKNNLERGISRPFHHTQWDIRDRQRNRFRPIASRSFGTQTSVTSDRGDDGAIGGSLPTRPMRPRTESGRTFSRLRLCSESEMAVAGTSPLPDVIPCPRDRSVSLPNVPAYRRNHERAVGRELRRISDEFLSSFTPIRQRNGGLPRSFPMHVNFDLHGCWNRIRRIVSSGSITPEAEENPFKFPPKK